MVDRPSTARPGAAERDDAPPRSRRWIDRLFALLVWLTAGLVVAAFAWIIGDLLRHGLGPISWSFLTEAPRQAGREGGIGPILVSTLLILGVCMAVSLPLGLGTAVLLAEFTATDRRFAALVRRSLDVLAGVPSIVFGLFGNAFFCLFLGMGYSIMSGGLTLACMVLPILIRSTEAGFRSVSDEHRLAGAALGISRTRLLATVLLPMAAPGLVVGLTLGVGRAIAETAALLFTSGYADRMPSSLWDSGRSLSIHIYDLSMNVAGGQSHAYASALVLVAMLLAINLAASSLAYRFLHREMMPD